MNTVVILVDPFRACIALTRTGDIIAALVHTYDSPTNMVRIAAGLFS